jgi:hypothetical protein
MKKPPLGGFFFVRPAWAQCTKVSRKKTRRLSRAGFLQEGTELLQFDFLVLDMLASFGVELHDQHLFRRCLFVLARGVKVTGARSGLQLDFFASAFSHGGAP